MLSPLGVNLVLKGVNPVKGPRHKGVGVDPGLVAMRTELARQIADRAVAEGDTLTEIPGLGLYRRSLPTTCTSSASQERLGTRLQS
jgi:hypothetical protein